VLEDRTLLAAPVLVKDIEPGQYDPESDPQSFTVVGDRVFFVSQSPLKNPDPTEPTEIQDQYRLCVTDGTAEGTYVVAANLASSPMYSLTNVNGKVFFIASQFGTGRELWVSDGTTEGTRFVKDIRNYEEYSGGPSQIERLTAVGDTLYFFANDGIHGKELWKSDGTTAGTVMVKDIRLGDASSNAQKMFAVGDRLLFQMFDSSVGSELWVSDGTGAGTHLLKDIFNGSQSTVIGDFAVLDDDAYFVATDGVNSRRLWKTDGTADGTILAAGPDAGGTFGSPVEVEAGDGFLFVTRQNGSVVELWRTDGTVGGSVQLTDGTTVSSPANLQFALGKLYFNATQSTTGRELWTSDGTVDGTQILFDVAPGLASSGGFSWLVAARDRVYFQANDLIHGRERWVTDGTSAGTHLVDDSRPGPDDSRDSIGAPVGSRMVYAHEQSPYHYELWVTDGTASETRLLKDLTPVAGNSSSPVDLVNANGTLFFLASANGVNGVLWKSDGTEAGTVPLTTLPGLAPVQAYYGLVAVGGTVFFTGMGAAGEELWKSDGTVAGTVMVKDIFKGWANSYPRNLTATGGILYFLARDGAGKPERMWKSDGTEAGTVPVTASDGASMYLGSEKAALNGRLYFLGSHPATGDDDLWSIGAGDTHATLVRDFDSGPTGITLRDLYVLNDSLYFRAHDSAFNWSLWKSDGTGAGTVEILPGLIPDGWSGYVIGDRDGELLVAASKLEQLEPSVIIGTLWTSDGTTAGSQILKTFIWDSLYYTAERFTQAQWGRYFFSNNTQTEGPELWMTDGTSEGTRLVRDLHLGPDGSYPHWLKMIHGVLYFVANDSYTDGFELWKSDGTAAGTVQVADLNLDGSAGPGYLTLIGTKLFFVAATPEAGVELWSLETNSAPTGVSLPPAKIAENLPGGTIVGQLTPIDGEPVDDFTFEFVAGTGDADNSLFSIVDGMLVTTTALDYEVKQTYSVRVRVTDGGGLTADQVLSIGVLDVDEFEVSAPADVDGAVNAVAESAAAGVAVGITAFAADADGSNNTVSYSLTDNAGGRFAIDAVSGVVTVADGSLLDYEAATSHSITVQAISSDGSSSVQSFTIQVGDVNELPSIALTSVITSFDENTLSPLVLAEISLLDDALGTNVLRLEGPDASFFFLEGRRLRLRTTGLYDFEVKPAYHVTIVVDDASLGGSIDASIDYTLSINDVNEPPIWWSRSGYVWLPENVTVPSRVGTFVYKDDALGSNVVALGGPDAAFFELIGNEVWFRSTTVVDFETKARYEIVLTVDDPSLGSGPDSTSVYAFDIRDVDEFNVGPVTDRNSAPDSVAENAATGTPVGITAFASDADGTNSAIAYSLWDTRGGRFAIDPVTGVVTVGNGALLDREVAASWPITVLATSEDGSVSVKTFTIAIADVDEFNVSQVLDLDPAPERVLENAANGTPVGITGFGIDLDATNSGVTYSLFDTRGGRFAIDAATGVVTVGNGALLNREVVASWPITVLATSADGSVSVKTFTIELRDVDEFEVGPVFDMDPAVNSVAENAANGTPVGITGFAVDQDATNSAVAYSLSDSAGGRFTIHPLTGVVTVANGALLDREAASAWNITVRALSLDGSSRSKVFSIALNDVDDLDVGPITDMNAGVNTVPENSPAGTLVGVTARAVDGDVSNNSVSYSLTESAGGRFQIDPVTGVVSVAAGAVLDFEAHASHEITARATGSDGSTSSQSYTIAVSNVFDAPRITLSNAVVPENLPAGTVVGSLGTADLEVAAPVYTLVSGTGASDNGKFQIIGNELRTRSRFNFEGKSSFSIRVQMRDGGGRALTQVLVIGVTNVNEGPTGVTLSRSTIAENNAIGVAVGTLAAVDPDGGDSFNYTLVPGSGSTDNGRFSIDGETLRAGEAFDYERQRSYSIRVRVTDAAGESYEKVLTVRVSNGPG